MIRTKRVYDTLDESDGYTALITRYWPRGKKREDFFMWCPELAPSKDLLKRYKNGDVKWPDFVKEFKKELIDNDEAMEAIKMIAIKCVKGDETTTLLCHEKPGEPCHRHIVREIIKDPMKLLNDFDTTFYDKEVPKKFPLYGGLLDIV